MTQAKLKGLSDRELLNHTQSLVAQERSTTLDILLHLNEVERRGLHLKLGYSSLFDYCTRRLKYSASAAGRRVQVARCVRRYPQVFELLRAREVNLSTVSLVAPILNDQNRRDVLKSIRGKSQREVEVIASQYRPPIALRDRVRPVRVRVPETAAARSPHDDTIAPSKTDNRIPLSSYSRSGSGKTPNRRARIEQKLLVQFLASEAFMKKYERVRALLSNRLSDTSFENVFEALIEEFIDRHSPESKNRRREKRRCARSQEPRRRSTGRPANGGAPGAHGDRSRHIPEALRDKVYERDGGRCTYVGSGGKRCRSTHALQIDHKKPFARGGKSTLSNLRLLCANHNRMAAEEAYGADFMEQFPKRE